MQCVCLKHVAAYNSSNAVIVFWFDMPHHWQKFLEIDTWYMYLGTDFCVEAWQV